MQAQSTGISKRVQRGIELARAGAVTRHGGPYDLFTVRGGSGRSYVVSLEHQCCSCEDHQYHGRETDEPCKHLIASTVYAAHDSCRRGAKITRH